MIWLVFIFCQMSPYYEEYGEGPLAFEEEDTEEL